LSSRKKTWYALFLQDTLGTCPYFGLISFCAPHLFHCLDHVQWDYKGVCKQHPVAP
jgi:hypothetical protein